MREPLRAKQVITFFHLSNLNLFTTLYFRIFNAQADKDVRASTRDADASIMNGILIIDKPEGYTSHDVVARMRGILKTKKIGHTGTLDPFATGVLVMLVGNATRLARFLDKDEKEYEAVLRFGFETDTGDRTGERKGESVNRKLEKQDIERILPDFRGKIEQIPPMYSAKKVKGKKLYELAREGIEIERKPVNVNILELMLIEPKEEIGTTRQPNDLEIETQDFCIRVTCTAGTYIRTLAEDIGRKIGVGCHLQELRRIRAGKFELCNALTLEELEEKVASETPDENLISMNEAVSHMPMKTLDEEELKLIKNGMKVGASFAGGGVLNVRLTDADENLIAIGEYIEESKEVQPRIVFLN